MLKLARVKIYYFHGIFIIDILYCFSDVIVSQGGHQLMVTWGVHLHLSVNKRQTMVHCLVYHAVPAASLNQVTSRTFRQCHPLRSATTHQVLTDVTVPAVHQTKALGPKHAWASNTVAQVTQVIYQINFIFHHVRRTGHRPRWVT